MIYTFDPPNDQDANEHVVQKYSQFSDEEIQWIRNYGDKLDMHQIKLYGNFDDTNVKASKGYFELNDDTKWVYDRMANLVQEVNSEYFKYTLTGFYENFYYQKYVAPKEHFNWHLDIGPETPAPRKLSAVLQLSASDEYDGGEFDVLLAVKHQRTFKAKGMVTFFPSFKIHRVTPVTRGIRRTLTMFTVGPNFR